jgi:NAD(P)-dependent dehydrogenase (short-subunit alcohol dehydrogenase family)
VGPRSGLAIARRFGQAGAYRLALVARSPAPLGQLVERLSKEGIIAETFSADAGDPQARGSLRAVVQTLFGSMALALLTLAAFQLRLNLATAQRSPRYTCPILRYNSVALRA